MQDTVCQSVGWKYANIGYESWKVVTAQESDGCRKPVGSVDRQASARSAEPIRNEIRASNA